MFLDLDRFKEVNDGMGHEAGDQLLIQLGRRLADSVRPSDTVARFGGDEFAILGDDLRSDGDAEQLARRTLSVFAEPITIQDREIFSTASLGVVVVEDPHAAPQHLLRDADAAMYQAKRRGGAAVRAVRAVDDHSGAVSPRATRNEDREERLGVS